MMEQLCRCVWPILVMISNQAKADFTIFPVQTKKWRPLMLYETSSCDTETCKILKPNTISDLKGRRRRHAFKLSMCIILNGLLIYYFNLKLTMLFDKDNLVNSLSRKCNFQKH